MAVLTISARSNGRDDAAEDGVVQGISLLGGYDRGGGEGRPERCLPEGPPASWVRLVDTALFLRATLD